MLVIRLFCNQGMSTSLLVEKMRSAAAKKGEEVDIEAFPINEIKDHLNGIDCALLGPQVAYLKSKVLKTYADKNIPIDVIAMTDYGMCNGENVLEFAKKLAGK